MCPNCRQDADLEAPVDVETEIWEAILSPTDPRTPIVNAGTTPEPQVKVIKFQPFPDLTTQSTTERERSLTNDLHNLSLNPNDANFNSRTSPDAELDRPNTLTQNLVPVVENDPLPSRTSRNGVSPSPIARVRAPSATRDGLEDLAIRGVTPTIDRGPFVYGDMTVNADGSAEATTPRGNVVQLPRESISEDANPLSTNSC